jgi:hypothetical protein
MSTKISRPVDDLGCVDEIDIQVGDDDGYMDIVMHCDEENKSILVTIGVDMARELFAKLPALIEDAETNLERMNHYV